MSEAPESCADIELTAKLVGLLEVPKTERDEQWIESFLSIAPCAALKSSTEQVVTGPDGFLYFCLFLPDEGETFTAVCLEDVKEFCASEGLGIVLFGRETNTPEWVFNYGTIWNYQQHRAFYDSPFAMSQTVIAMKNEEKSGDGSDSDASDDDTSGADEAESVMVASPSEELLPTYVRAVLLRDLEQQKVERPAMALMTVPNGLSYFVFNIFPEDFDADHFEFIQRYLGWALPQGYSTATVEKSAEISSHFISLAEMLGRDSTQEQ